MTDLHEMIVEDMGNNFVVATFVIFLDGEAVWWFQTSGFIREPLPALDQSEAIIREGVGSFQ